MTALHIVALVALYGMVLALPMGTAALRSAITGVGHPGDRDPGRCLCPDEGGERGEVYRRHAGGPQRRGRGAVIPGHGARPYPLGHGVPHTCARCV